MFRARTYEGLVVVIAGLFVLMRYAPMGSAIWAPFGPIGEWIMSVPNSAVQRGLLISAGAGGVMLGIRMLLGQERGFMGEEK